MFIDTKERPTGEVQQKVGRLKLSEAIRIGARQTLATKDINAKAWLTRRDGRCFSCVIGAAWVGLHGLNWDKYANEPSIVREVLTQTGASMDIYEQAQYRYEHQDQSRESIADWLESKGL